MLANQFFDYIHAFSDLRVVIFIPKLQDHEVFPERFDGFGPSHELIVVHLGEDVAEGERLGVLRQLAPPPGGDRVARL